VKDIFTTGSPMKDVSLFPFRRLGVFADWKLPSDQELEFVSQELRFNDIVLGIARQDAPGWKPRYHVNRIEKAIERCRQAHLEPVLMVWADKNQSRILSMLDFCLDVTGPETAILLDAEENWYKGNLSNKEAARIVAEKLQGRTWGVTGIGNIHSTVVPLAELSHFTVPQCYSFWKPGGNAGGRHWSHSKLTFPGPQQELGVRKWKKVSPQAGMAMGLGCYWAERPSIGLTPRLSVQQTMRFSAIETLAQGVDSAWYWSLKWILAKTPEGDKVREFFGVQKKT